MELTNLVSGYREQLRLDGWFTKLQPSKDEETVLFFLTAKRFIRGEYWKHIAPDFYQDLVPFYG